MLPLEGITVVSLEQAVAAPFATRQLADLGARVIMVERPEVGDFARGYDRTVNGLSSHFVWLNRSKDSASQPSPPRRTRFVLVEAVHEGVRL
jgi:itaconate CoA-transferase